VFDPVEEVGSEPLDLAEHLDALVALEEFLEEHPDLESGERCPEAEVGAAGPE